MSSVPSRAQFGEQFQLSPGYLDTPSVGVPTAAIAATLGDAVARWGRGELPPARIAEATERARAGFAHLIGVAPETVATGTSVAALVGLLAAQVPAGTRVLSVAGEYSSVTLPFVAQAGRGVTLTMAAPATLPELVATHDLVALSPVQSRDGAVVDLDALRAAVERTGARVILDVTQTAGWRPLELSWADAVVGAGYKWLLAPRGIAWLALRRDFAGTLVPIFANWRATASGAANTYGAHLDLPAAARRFDSPPVWPCVLAAAEALDWLRTVDLAAVRDHCVGLADAVRDAFGLPRAASPIVAVPDGRSAAELAELGLRATAHDGGTRVGFHLYNTDADARICIDVLRQGAAR